MNIVTQRLATNSNSFLTVLKFYASKMQASSTQNNRDSAGRRLGLKKFGGEQVMPGDIIARQRGFKWQPGQNVIVGKDQTIHARCEGIVKFRQSQYRKVPFYFIDVTPCKLPNKKHRHPAPYIYHPELFPERQQLNHPQLKAVDRYRVTYQGKQQILKAEEQMIK